VTTEVETSAKSVCPYCGGEMPTGSRRCWLCREEFEESNSPRGAARRSAANGERSSAPAGGTLLSVLGYMVLGAIGMVTLLIIGFAIGVVAVFGAFLSICSSMSGGGHP